MAKTAQIQNAAYTEGQEPVANIDVFDRTGQGIKDWEFTDSKSFYDLPYGRYKLFTAPPEPSFQHCDTCGSSAWVCSVCHPRPAARAATSSEEVRDAVARLSDGFYDLDEGDCKRISDLIERLAARVPDGCVVVGYLDGRGRFFYADDPHMETDHTGMREVIRLERADAEHNKLAKAMNAALEIVTTDRCDGDSAFASGVNAACERHAIGIRSIIEGVKK